MANIDKFRGPKQFNPLSIHYVPRDVFMHTVSEDDLEALAGSGDGIYLAALEMTSGALISLSTTLITVPIPDPFHHATFVLLTWGSGILSLVFGAKVVTDRIAVSGKLRRYREASGKMVVGSPTGEVLNVPPGQI